MCLTRNWAGANPEKAGYANAFAGWPKFSYLSPSVSVSAGVAFQLSWRK